MPKYYFNHQHSFGPHDDEKLLRHSDIYVIRLNHEAAESDRKFVYTFVPHHIRVTSDLPTALVNSEL